MFFRPARDDPSHRHLAGLIDDAYLSPTPESRVPMFYVESSADPRVLELDEAIKGTMTRGEMSDIGTVSDRAAEIRVPVLVLVGEHDALMFDHETETDTYQSTRRSASKSPGNFTFEVVPGAGHNLNLHRQAHNAHRSTQKWLDAQVVLADPLGRGICPDDRDERDALAGLAAEVVRQRQAAPYLLGADPAVLRGLAA
jgi:pimeloyl-ACP methyl ester carboxylesterase